MDAARRLDGAGAPVHIRGGSWRHGADPGTDGAFVVRIAGPVIWSRKEDGRFPVINELKRRVRDHVAPDKFLGHVDDGGGSRLLSAQDEKEDFLEGPMM
jgi:hypothetical protein